MLSVVIATEESERPLLLTLAALVPGATAGIVREVIVADAGSRDGTARVADIAGCRFEASRAPLGVRLKAAAASAKGPWLLFLRPGVVPQAAWIDEIDRFLRDSEVVADAGGRAAIFRAAPGSDQERSPILEALFVLLSALRDRPRPEQGLLIAKNLYERLGGHSADGADPETALLRQLGRRRIVTLRCGAGMATR
jgi:hypothetical protein